MRYFYDFEFVEHGPDRPLRPISLGIVSEDGRELYMQFIDYLVEAARNPWLAENVLPRLDHFDFNQGSFIIDPPPLRCFDVEDIDLAKCPWLYATDAADEIEKFLSLDSVEKKPELWGYYADYDHVLFAQLFGTVMTLPKKLPIWTRDLRQLTWMLGDVELPTLPGEQEHHALHDAREIKHRFEFLQSEMRLMSMSKLGYLVAEVLS